ncbi:hypothetical protein Tco_0351509 [Tanacetum coccineum]
MDAQITVDVVLHGGEMLPIQKVLQNTISVKANEREEAVLLPSQCQEQDINRLCLKLGTNVSGNPSLTLDKRVLQIFAEWSRLVTVLLLSVGCKMKSNFEATIVSYLREWKPTLRLVAFDAAIGYLHLRRNGEEKVLFVTPREENDPVMIWELDLGNSLRCLYMSYFEGDGVNEEESEAYDIGTDGLVRVARVYGEVGMLAQAEMGCSFRIWVSRFLRATPSSDGDI